MRCLVVLLGLVVASPAYATSLHGLVFDDINGDGLPSPGEPGVPGVVVAAGVQQFVVTDAKGEYTLTTVPLNGIVWARVPDGFVPGPVWTHVTTTFDDADLALHRAPPRSGPLTFAVAADTHIYWPGQFVTGDDLASTARMATALDTEPAFFTILGDITQGNQREEFALVDDALAGLDVPFIPVPGNHDWYDGGAAWFEHYGPDNYSFDIGTTHFVVWNTAMSQNDIDTYLGAELAHVSPDMTVVALTHAPPSEEVVDTLRSLGVDYVLSGHAHSNRVVDHGGIVELNTEPMLMGGLDFTPGGYRVFTLEHERLSSVHHTTLEQPFVALMWPRPDACVPAGSTAIVVAAELDGSRPTVTARLDCGATVTLHAVGGWGYTGELPPLMEGRHSITVVAKNASGERTAMARAITVCEQGPAPTAGEPWPQVGGGPAHRGARAHELAPPLATRWVTAIGGHVVTAAPVIDRDTVFVAVSDLADGKASAVAAVDLATGKSRWVAYLPAQIRGGVAIADGGFVIAPLLDGTVLGLDEDTGAIRWRQELAPDEPPEARALFAPPTVDADAVLIGNKRAAGALMVATGVPQWLVDPVPDGRYGQSLAAMAVGDGITVGTFDRDIGGVIAWDRQSGARLWQQVGEPTIAVNAGPVISDGVVYFVNASDEVTAIGVDGEVRWRVRLDPAGFEWAMATVGTPAISSGILIVPTLYRDLVALDTATGRELWRFAATPGPLRTTHYRGGGQAGFAASPVITGETVWAVDTAGNLSALDLHSGRLRWQTSLDAPVLAGLAVSGDWIVAASYDGTLHALAHSAADAIPSPAQPVMCTAEGVGSGCCDAHGRSTGVGLGLLLIALRYRRRRSSRNV